MESDDERRYRWLKKHVVFLHQFANSDPHDGPFNEWSIEGDWTDQPNNNVYRSLDEAIDIESGWQKSSS